MTTGQKPEMEQQPCRCPYCNGATGQALPFCQLCGAAIVRCAHCGKALEQDATSCPGCGTEVERTTTRRRGRC